MQFKSLTREEFNAKYGDVVTFFSHYYKYTFYYVGTTPEGYRLVLRVGGTHDDIYRLEVAKDDKLTADEGYPFSGDVYDPATNKPIEGFHDFG